MLLYFLIMTDPIHGNSTYSDELAAEFCRRLEKRPIVSVCKDSDMPVRDTIWNWHKTIPAFSDMYEKALLQFFTYGIFEEMLDLAYNCKDNGESIQHARMKIETLKFNSQKVLPKIALTELVGTLPERIQLFAKMFCQGKFNCDTANTIVSIMQKEAPIDEYCKFAPIATKWEELKQNKD